MVLRGVYNWYELFFGVFQLESLFVNCRDIEKLCVKFFGVKCLVLYGLYIFFQNDCL